MFVFTPLISNYKMFIKNLKIVLRKVCPKTDWTLEHFRKR